MLNIYVCEDNLKQRMLITDYIKNIILIEDYDLNLELSTDNPYEVLDSIENSKNVGLYFLDIDLNYDIDGLSLARQIRRHDPRGFIVFITAHSEMCYMTFTYKVEAMDFIIKDDQDNLHSRIHQCIQSAYSRYSSTNNHTDKIFVTKIGDKEYCIPLSDIIYIETSVSPHKIILHTAYSTLEFKGQIKATLPILGSDFVLCHRSTIVNKNHVKEIDLKGRTLTLTGGHICPIAVRYMPSMHKCFQYNN